MRAGVCWSFRRLCAAPPFGIGAAHICGCLREEAQFNLIVEGQVEKSINVVVMPSDLVATVDAVISNKCPCCRTR